MRTILAATVLAMSIAAPAAAQRAYGGLPPGSYQSQCSNIRMEGQFLHAYCRGRRGAGESSINVQSCSTGIFVDDSGGLTCIGPGGGAPPQPQAGQPGYYTGPPPVYGNRGQPGYAYDRRARGAAVLFAQRSWRGPALRIEGPTPNLGDTGLNDRVRSIQLDGRSGPWLVCSDAGYRGRCVTVRNSVADTRSLGLGGGISSLRPAR